MGFAQTNLVEQIHLLILVVSWLSGQWVGLWVVRLEWLQATVLVGWGGLVSWWVS